MQGTYRQITQEQMPFSVNQAPSTRGTNHLCVSCNFLHSFILWLSNLEPKRQKFTQIANLQKRTLRIISLRYDGPSEPIFEYYDILK